MEKVEFIWELYQETEDLPTIRHCPNCNKKVYFYDSLKRRHNANGKDIFEYAIFKCEKGHTWNKLLKTHKTTQSNKEATEFIELAAEKKTKVDIINVSYFFGKGVTSINIFLQVVQGRWRLDKVLSNQIEDLSRSQIEKMIINGAITLDGKNIKPNAALKSKQTITVQVLQLT